MRTRAQVGGNIFSRSSLAEIFQIPHVNDGLCDLLVMMLGGRIRNRRYLSNPAAPIPTAPDGRPARFPRIGGSKARPAKDIFFWQRSVD